MGTNDIRNYKILKVMNNNVVLAKNLKDQKEQVLVGKGLGFGVKAGVNVSWPRAKIEKKFVAINHELYQEYLQLVQQLDLEVMGLCEEFIAYADTELGGLNPHIHIALSDHIGFAIERINAGQEIVNPFVYQIKALYKEEFRVARKAKEMIKDALDVDINESEIGFIALHLHSSRQNRSIQETVRYTRVLNESVSIIESKLQFTLDQSSLTYSRLMSHLRGLIERVVTKQTIENKLLANIKEEFYESFAIASSIGKVMEEELEVKVHEEELGYMAIHIDRVRRIAKLNK